MKNRFADLQQRAKDAFAEGDLRLSIELFTRAEHLAAEHGEPDLVDRAFCNRCAVLIDLEESRDQIPKLKAILLRSRDPRNRYLAAYYTAEAYRTDDDRERALSYARRSVELAEELDDPPSRAASANLVGNIALRSSDLDEAEHAFQTALECYEGAGGYHRIMAAQVTDNLGYLRMCSGRLRDGLELCERARRSFEELDADQYLYETLQDLCYGYTLNDQLDQAESCGEQALQLAIEHSDELIAKNCLFLLSEIAVRQGDSFRARRLLRELIAHYPEVGISEEIVEVFLSTDLTTVVNLRG